MPLFIAHSPVLPLHFLTGTFAGIKLAIKVSGA